jgi:hypothetical protein
LLAPRRGGGYSSESGRRMARPTVQLGCQEGETGRSQWTAARHFASDARPGRVRFSCKSGTTEFANPTGWERPSGSRLSRRGWPFDPGFKRNPGVADGSISRPASEPLDAISSHPAFVSVRAVLCSSCAIESRACLSGLARKFAQYVVCEHTWPSAENRRELGIGANDCGLVDFAGVGRRGWETLARAQQRVRTGIVPGHLTRWLIVWTSAALSASRSRSPGPARRSSSGGCHAGAGCGSG